MRGNLIVMFVTAICLFSLSPSFLLIPQILIGSITLLQKFTPHFKILDPRLVWAPCVLTTRCCTKGGKGLGPKIKKGSADRVSKELKMRFWYLLGCSASKGPQRDLWYLVGY